MQITPNNRLIILLRSVT